MTEVELAGYLRALAIDCENTDGWEEAAPDLREAADKLEALAGRVAMLTGHVVALVDLVDANSMPLSRDEYRYVKVARADLAQTQSEG